jgi:hypothetical protein
MVEKEVNDEYMRLYEELVERVNTKEKVIEKMTRYIVRNAEKNQNMCNRKKVERCNEKQCMKCVRSYFDKS